MSHFSRDALEADPEGLERLRRILHGPNAKAKSEADRPAKGARKAIAGPNLVEPLPLLVGQRHDDGC